jgi:hypothetical protein
LLTAKFIVNCDIDEGWIVYCVETLPEVGENCTNADMNFFVGYYNVADNLVYGYVSSDLGAAFNVPAGWYTYDVLSGVSGGTFGGVITDYTEDPADGALRVLLDYEYYTYKHEWVKHIFAYEKPPKYNITWDGDMTDRIALDMSQLGYDEGLYFVKVSDDVLTTDELIGSTYIERSFVDGVYNNEIYDYDLDTEQFPGAIKVASSVVVVYDSDQLATSLGIPSGIYTNGVYFYINTNFGYISSFVSSPRIKKIDGKYLENIGVLAEVAYTGDYYSLTNRPSLTNYATKTEINTMISDAISNAIYNAMGGSY